MKTKTKTRVSGLHDVECCGVYLCSAPANTSVMCPKCNRWAYVIGTAERVENNDTEGNGIRQPI